MGKECLIERTYEKCVSIKRNQPTRPGHTKDVIALNPAYTELYDLHARQMGLYTADEDWLSRVCDQCRLCDPLFYIQHSSTGQKEIRIMRRDYSENGRLQTELYKATEYPMTTDLGNVGHGDKIALLDDVNTDFIALFADIGFQSMGITVNRNVRTTEEDYNRILWLIRGFDPRFVISDKGLGYTDGLRIISSLKELGFYTVLLTGEPQTEETKSIAHKFLRKPLLVSEMLEALGYAQN